MSLWRVKPFVLSIISVSSALVINFNSVLYEHLNDANRFGKIQKAMILDAINATPRLYSASGHVCVKV